MEEKVQLDDETLNYIIKFCKEEQAATHSIMLAARWGEVIDKLNELKEVK